MLKKRHKPELIVTKLRQVDVLISQGQGNCLASVRSAWARPRTIAGAKSSVAEGSLNQRTPVCVPKTLSALSS